MVRVIISIGNSGPHVVRAVRRIRKKDSVSRNEIHSVMIHFTVDVPFQNDHIPGFFRSNDYVKWSNRSSISGRWRNIRPLSSRLYRLNLDHCSRNWRGDFIFYLLNVSKQLVPL